MHGGVKKEELWSVRNSTKRLLVGGFAGTVTMTTALLAATANGAPNMDYAALLSESVLHQSVSVFTSTWWIGMVFHVIIGSLILVFVYSEIFYDNLHGRPWMRGLQWGVMLWFVLMFFMMPMMGKGFFGINTPKPISLNIGTLIGHALYGMILGAIAGPQTVGRRYDTPAWHGW